MKNTRKGYGPDELSNVYSFARSQEEAEQIAAEANRHGVTRKGKFVPNSFTVVYIPGRTFAVIGGLEEGAM